MTVAIKTANLTDKALDWAVCFARTLEAWEGRVILARDLMDKALKNGLASPSTDWAEGGPIIERCHVCLYVGHDGVWIACIRQNYDDVVEYMYGGETPLVAAMRCYVASKLGDVVGVPDELMVSS